MRPALTVELLKLRRSRVVWSTSLLIVLLVPVMCLGFVGVAENGGSGALGAKAAAMVTGEGWEAYFSLLAQIMSVTLFIGPGVVAAWVFGREHAEHTFASLFALPVTRRAIALAKLQALLGWGAVLTIALLGSSFLTGLLADVGPLSDIALVPALGRLGLAGLLTTVIATTVGLVASIGRGYLPAIGAIILLTAAAQVSVLLGTGAWFPYAAPGLYGLAGAEGISEVTPIQLLLVPITAVGIGLATAQWWQRAEVR